MRHFLFGGLLALSVLISGNAFAEKAACPPPLTGDVTSFGCVTLIPGGAVTNAMLAGSIDPAKIVGTAATLGANSFTGLQTVNGNSAGKAFIGGTNACAGNFVSITLATANDTTCTTFHLASDGAFGLFINAPAGQAIYFRNNNTAIATWDTNLSFLVPIIYGGVTLNNAVTGTGNMVLSSNPTITLANATGLPRAGMTVATTNTITGNATSGSASPTDLPIGTCSTAASALIWTTNTGFGCNVNITAGSVTDALDGGSKVSTGTLTATTNTTLATVTGLSINLTAGKTYSCKGHLTGVSGATGGIKVALVATNSLSATSSRFTGLTWNGTTPVAQTTVTTLGSSIVGNAAIYSDVYIEGAIVVNVAGTINVQAAQFASNGTATTVLPNSTFSCTRTT